MWISGWGKYYNVFGEYLLNLIRGRHFVGRLTVRTRSIDPGPEWLVNKATP